MIPRIPATLLLLAAACGSADEGATRLECEDGEDNDGDGAVDCEDDGCAAYSVCSGTDTGSLGPPPAVLVNEFQASNASTIQDESGAWPDWIELYNHGDEDVDLEGFTITDDLAVPDKHVLPSIALPAGGFVLLYADGDVEEGDRHLPFRLDMDGEEIGLYDPFGRPLTELTYDAQATDWSAARIPDASSNWEITDHPTPGTSNSAAR